MTSHSETIRQRAHAVVNAVVSDEVGSWRWIKRLVATTVKEYRGRFLHELIQNGFDAHPDRARDGRIAVHFYEDEGPHGVLYVANGGRPLSKSNFEKMASLGDSDKEIGVGIGNKGVGFKSVFQVCHAPEVYSAADATDPGFSGFTFRFGTRDDLDEFGLSADHAAKVEQQLSLSLLTMPLDRIPDRVSELRAAGYVTVIRLPASSTRSATEIQDRIDRLLTSRSPIMLFLDRLESLSVRASTSTAPTVLTRREEHHKTFARVVLNDDERYLMFRTVVPHEVLQAALMEAVDEGSLDDSWLAWTEDATVSVAVGDNWMIQDPAPFTFLPMGDQTSSPLAGHINAPFVTDFARLGLDREQPVNRLMLQKIADLCLTAASSIIDSDGDANTVVDLLAWDQEDSHWLEERLSEQSDVPVKEFVRLPAMARREWARLDQLCLWPNAELALISADHLVTAADAVLIDRERVDELRLERLEDVAISRLDPDPDVAAGWVEAVAADMQRKGLDLGSWQKFYDDLPKLFESGAPLSGRRIMLAQNMTLMPAEEIRQAGTNARPKNRRQRAIFFNPKTFGTEDDDAVESDSAISPPKSLASRLVFLHRELDWYDSSEQTPGRHFLQSEGLARQFRVATLLTFLGRLMREQANATVKKDGLQFAFGLFSNNPTKYAKELAAVGLSVPVADNKWMPASQARFSNEWPVDGAKALTALAAIGSTPDSELTLLANCLLPEPQAMGIASDDVERWTSFLKVLGVTATLPINEAKDSRRIRGNELMAYRVAHTNLSSRVPAGVIDQWTHGITNQGNNHHPYTDFTTRDPVYWFAGQHEIADHPARLRRDYARLVLLTLPTMSDQHFWSTWRRDRSGGVETYIESPILAFLTAAEWVPVTVPGTAEPEFATPGASWYVGVEDQIAAAYSPLIEPNVRTLIAVVEPSCQHWKDIGFLNWTSEFDAAQLIDHLTTLFRTADIPDTAHEHFRASLATAWAAVGNPNIGTRPAMDDELLVEITSRIELCTREDLSDRTLYVSSLADQSASTRIVRELGWPTVTVDSSSTERLNEVAGVLANSWQDNVQVTSDWNLEVRLDGQTWQPEESDRYLVNEIPWLPILIASVMRFPHTSGMRIGRELGRVLDELSRIRTVAAEDVAIVAHSGDQALPARLHGVLPMPGDAPTLLTEGHASPPTWTQFEYLVRGTLELLKQDRFTTEISLAIRELRTGAHQQISRPSTSEIAEALQVAEAQIDEVQALVYGATAGVISRIAEVVPCLWGDASLEVITDPSMVTISHDELLHVISELCGDEAIAHEIIKAATDSADSNSLRRKLHIPLKEFNACLERHFPSRPLINNDAQHAEEFSLRVRSRRAELRGQARQARFARFQAGFPQRDWPEIRDLSFLGPDPDWATTLDDLGDELIDSRIDEQMVDVLGAEVSSDSSLPDWADTHAANGKPLRTQIVSLRSLIRAWCAHARVDVAPAWDADDYDRKIWEKLDVIGALDFTILGDTELAQWLSRIGAWPTGMPLTTAPSDLGLTADEVAAQQTVEADDQAARARTAKQIRYQDSQIDLDASMSSLVEHISAFLLSEPPSLRTPYRSAAILELSGPSAHNTASGSGSSGRPFTPRLSDAQRGAMGLIGELIAFDWLKRYDPGVVDELCWKSGNAQFAFEGIKGDDGLGFDFEVPRKGGSVMYEVKATAGDAGMIELGETEVRCAQTHSRNDRWRLIIVENALSVEPRVHMLPNPFHHDSRSLFSFIGNSIRMRFHLAS